MAKFYTFYIAGLFGPTKREMVYYPDTHAVWIEDVALSDESAAHVAAACRFLIDEQVNGAKSATTVEGWSVSV